MKKLNEIFLSMPKEACELCGQEFPSYRLMDVSKNDQRLSCSACALDKTKRIVKKFFGQTAKGGGE